MINDSAIDMTQAVPGAPESRLPAPDLFQVPDIGVGPRDERIGRFAAVRVEQWERTDLRGGTDDGRSGSRSGSD